MQSDSANTQRVKVTNIYRRNEKAKAQTIVNVGGAGSSKTHSISQFYIFKRLLPKHNRKILILRKTVPSLKISVYKHFFDLTKDYGIYNDKHHNKTDRTYVMPGNNNYMLFTSMDDRQKIKSTEWHDIWVEEANEFSFEDFLFLKTRLYRGVMEKGDKAQIRLSLNPIECWIHGLEGKSEVDIVHSTYKDNPFANKQAIATLEGLKDDDETYYNIYALGKWATAKGLIYKPYIMEQEYPEEFDEVIYGLDFGYNSPSALIEIGIKDVKECYLDEKIYQTKLTNADLIELMKEEIPEEHRNRQIYADSEDPNRIEEISQAGFNIIPAIKGKGSVKTGIDICKRMNFHTREDNVKINKENTVYKWKVDKNDKALDEPVKFMDHGQDAKRYAIATHFIEFLGGARMNLEEVLSSVQLMPDRATAEQNW